MSNHLLSKSVSTLIMLGLAGGGIAFAASNKVNAGDKSFVMAAARANASEIGEGKAEQNSSDKDAAMFAQRMIKDHTKANDQLQTVAQNLGLSTQFKEGKNDAKKPQQLPGKQYLKMEIPNHQKAIHLFQDEAKNGGSAQLRDYAKKTLPILEMHLDLAQKYSK